MNLDVLFNVTSSLLASNFVQSLVSAVESIPSSAVVRDAAHHIDNTVKSVSQLIVNISTPIHFEFSELQTTLLIVFLVIIGVNILLIVYYWNKYGGVITDRFIRPSAYSISIIRPTILNDA